MSLNKDKLVSEIKSYRRKIPKPKSDTESWLIYLQKLNIFIKEIQQITGKFDVVLSRLWKDFTITNSYKGEVPATYKSDAKFYFIVGKNLERFFNVLEEWVKDGFEHDRFPLKPDLDITPRFRFYDSVLYRDFFNGAIYLKEDTNEHNLMAVAMEMPVNSRIDCAVQGIDRKDFRKLYDDAGRLNNKISKKFKVSEFFERNFSDKYLQRTVE